MRPLAIKLEPGVLSDTSRARPICPYERTLRIVASFSPLSLLSFQDREILSEYGYSAPKGLHSRVSIYFTSILFMSGTHQALGQALGIAMSKTDPAELIVW